MSDSPSDEPRRYDAPNQEVVRTMPNDETPTEPETPDEPETPETPPTEPDEGESTG